MKKFLGFVLLCFFSVSAVAAVDAGCEKKLGRVHILRKMSAPFAYENYQEIAFELEFFPDGSGFNYKDEFSKWNFDLNLRGEFITFNSSYDLAYRRTIYLNEKDKHLFSAPTSVARPVIQRVMAALKTSYIYILPFNPNGKTALEIEAERDQRVVEQSAQCALGLLNRALAITGN